MNLRNAEDYTIGLDLGTGSVGWCVVDENGDLYHIKGQPTWGSRLFPSAETAATTRVKRGQRRRYDRRRERLDCLQSIFFDEMDKVDSEFFVRMRQSSLMEEDRDPSYDASYHYPFFNGTDFTEQDYYDRFPTIWHLRKFLMESDEKADIRLVYLALHNIMKCRGNFLHEDESNLRASNANAQAAAQNLADEFTDYVELLAAQSDEDVSCSPDVAQLRAALEKRGCRKTDRAKLIQEALGASDKNLASGVARACAGCKVEYSKVFAELEKQDGSNFELSNDDGVEKFLPLCPDEAKPLFEAMQAAYSASVLSELLNGQDSLSAAMIASYDQHRSDLKLLKGLVREYLGKDAYDQLFRGPKTSSGDYDINSLPKNSYTAYIRGETLANRKGCSQEDFVKNVRELFKGNEAFTENRGSAEKGKIELSEEKLINVATTYLESATGKTEEQVRDIRESAFAAAGRPLSDKEIAEGFASRLLSDDGEFLAKQKTRANGAIPYQLHLEEMDRIINKQGVHYPFLLENKELLEKLVSSRIPYYVGPLNGGHDPNPDGYPSNPIDDGKRKFAWSVRRPGMEDAKAYPWNVEEIIDTDETAERFIQRMTGTCTYLYGEPVLPRCSLLYEEYCVLNELNGARWGKAKGDTKRFDHEDREALVEELFKGRKTVSHKAVATWLERRNGTVDACIEGTQAENAFESKLNSYNDFCGILGVNRLEDPGNPLSIDDIEQIILWNTVFEDRDILKRKIQQSYGEVLSDKQINQIVRKRYQGWGRLSKKFLCGLKIDTPHGPMSIMDILRDGDPTTGHANRAMNLMEILHEDSFGFEKLVDEENKKKFGEEGNALTVDDLPGSPALRRSVNQAMKIIDEIVGITGHAPASIVIEVTRDDDDDKKGKRSTKRYDHLKEALEAYRQDVADFDPGLMRELESRKDDLSDDKLMLYFSQNGKCLYSGEPLDINRLNEYHIDHIIPQAYIKDDSLDNRALVKSELNERKLDSMLLPNDIVSSQRTWWGQLHDAKLMSDKKYDNLRRTYLSDEKLKGFINRQLVETSQIVKFVRQMCEQKYPGTEIVSLRASLSHGLREKCGFVKCRELNDFHHAHDAYLACQMARFVAYRYPTLQESSETSASIVRAYVKGLAAQNKKEGKRNTGSAGFIVDSFMRDGFDRETGEIRKDAWDAEREIAKIRHDLDIKQCFISRMVEEQTGAFWDETIYSPKDAKHKPESLVPLKGYGSKAELDPAKYGGFNNPQRAYFFIFQAKDKKGRVKYFFEGVPIHLLDVVARDPESLTAYAEKIAEGAGCSGAQVLRAKVPLRQKFEMDGTEFILCGRSNKSNGVRPAREIAVGQSIAKDISRVLAGKETLKVEEYVGLYSYIASHLELTCPKLSDSLSLPSRKSDFQDLDPEGKTKVIRNILMAAKGDSQGCDLTLVGGKSKSGYMLVDLASHIPDITWIDQSVTGIFETRTTLEDMQNGLQGGSR